ncbi:MAG: orotidine 5'-phosphate decarboxylase / HUMPS family protein, partial [candidate division WOR-3 bacterium]
SMLMAAVEEARSSPVPPFLLAVTALTSLSQADIAKLGVIDPVERWVERLAETAFEAGIRGIVASAAELPMLRRKFQDQVQVVVPGIRPSGSPAHDQSRAATPRQAISAGADYIVVGRPILHSPDPAAAADEIVEEIRRALEPHK